jgi:outer membrane lipoprotein LolB
VSGACARRAACAALAVLWIAGCSSLPTDESVDTLSGRLILQVGPGAGTAAQQWSAGFELRGSAQAGELALTSPLGTTVAHARWRPGSVELQQGGEHRAFADLGELSRQLLGQDVPLEALFDWLRGRPWPAARHESTTQGFVQQGWTVDLSGHGEGRVTARRDQAPAIILRARLQVTP